MTNKDIYSDKNKVHVYSLMIITVYCGFNAMNASSNAMCSSSQDNYYDHYENCLTSL